MSIAYTPRQTHNAHGARVPGRTRTPSRTIVAAHAIRMAFRDHGVRSPVNLPGLRMPDPHHPKTHMALMHAGLPPAEIEQMCGRDPDLDEGAPFWDPAMFSISLQDRGQGCVE